MRSLSGSACTSLHKEMDICGLIEEFYFFLGLFRCQTSVVFSLMGSTGMVIIKHIIRYVPRVGAVNYKAVGSIFYLSTT